MKLNKSALIIGFATTVLLLAGSLVTLNAGDIATGKGGAKLLLKQDAPAPVTGTMVSKMACTRCTDTYTSVRDLSARGANKPVTLVAQHQCGGCSTHITTTGTGKAKQSTATHACTLGAGQNLTCCTRNQ